MIFANFALKKQRNWQNNIHDSDSLRLGPMNLADACLVRMAEVHERCQVFTTDRDFLVYRRKGRSMIPLLAPFQSK